MKDFDYFDETGEDGFEYGSVSGLTLDKSKEGSPFLDRSFYINLYNKKPQI